MHQNHQQKNISKSLKKIIYLKKAPQIPIQFPPSLRPSSPWPQGGPRPPSVEGSIAVPSCDSRRMAVRISTCRWTPRPFFRGGGPSDPPGIHRWESPLSLSWVPQRDVGVVISPKGGWLVLDWKSWVTGPGWRVEFYGSDICTNYIKRER